MPVLRTISFPTGVTCLAADNARLADCARLQHLAPFDVVFGGHMLCTCRWPSRPFAFCRAAAATTAAAASSPPPLGEEATLQPAAATLQPAAAQRAARTCGGIAIDAEEVDGFVDGLRPLLGRRGVAVFDHEGGWPWGLEALLRRAARRRGLFFYVRRGPLFTNFDYVLSARPLFDDVSGDPLQRDARAVAWAFLSFAPAVALLAASFRAGALPQELAPHLEVARRGAALALAVRLLLPFADVLTSRDLVLALGLARPPPPRSPAPPPPPRRRARGRGL